MWIIHQFWLIAESSNLLVEKILNLGMVKAHVESFLVNEEYFEQYLQYKAEYLYVYPPNEECFNKGNFL